MSMDETLARFEESDAGRVLGDLTSEETSEWQILVTDMEDVHSIELELLATELELKHVQPCDLSSSLSNKIADTIPTFSNKNVNQSATQIISILPWLGWAAAACLLVFFQPTCQFMVFFSFFPKFFGTVPQLFPFPVQIFLKVIPFSLKLGQLLTDCRKRFVA